MIDMVLEIKDLNYDQFDDFNLVIEEYKSYSIIGDIYSGKDTLFRIIASYIMTDNKVFFNGLSLNSTTRLDYLKKMGIIPEVDSYSFLMENVIDELEYPLKRLGLKKEIINKRVNFYLKFFNLRVKTKKIEDLDIYEKQLLLIIIAMITEPTLVIIDDIYDDLLPKDKIKFFDLLNHLIDANKITVLKFTTSFVNVLERDRVLVMDNYELLKEDTKANLMENDKYLTDRNLKIPFMYDLSIKLGMYNILDKKYLNMDDMVNDIWK